MMQPNLTIEREQLKVFCRRWGINELSLFGSILRDDFRQDSDVDVLVAFTPESKPSLFDLVTLKEELEQLFGRRVDLVTRQGIESSPNWIRRAAILDTAERIV
ncbi:MAG: nucleotidyltransferase family protein [Thermomicrobiales bacterium]